MVTWAPTSRRLLFLFMIKTSFFSVELELTRTAVYESNKEKEIIKSDLKLQQWTVTDSKAHAFSRKNRSPTGNESTHDRAVGREAND